MCHVAEMGKRSGFGLRFDKDKKQGNAHMIQDS